MKILVTGSSGLIGSALLPALNADGHEIIRLVRIPTQSAGTIILWDPKTKDILDKQKLEGLDAIVHLAGESLSTTNWTPEKKARIRNSRVQGTHFLSETLSGLTKKPRVFLSASAVGFYGNRGDEPLKETSQPGTGFLSSVCRDWEMVTGHAADAGIRVVLLRLGMVLSPNGGALAKMLPVFRAGFGSRLGTGRQYVSWISIEDTIRAIQHLLLTESVSGPVNVVSPRPVTNAEFTATLNRVLKKRGFPPVPAFLLRLLFGEIAQDVLLASARALPEKLAAAGFSFQHPDLETALRRLLDTGRT